MIYHSKASKNKTLYIEIGQKCNLIKGSISCSLTEEELIFMLYKITEIFNKKIKSEKKWKKQNLQKK